MPEHVVLLDTDGRPTGQAPKATVHSTDTPLHLAFSCYLLNDAGELLVTRRALSKKAWPGVWTNSYCGHPAPGEDLVDAVRRRGAQELTASVTSIELRLPAFRYRAVDAHGTVENEICPVFTATTTGDIAPVATEVVEWEWLAPHRLLDAVTSAPFVFSPWLREQLPQLIDAGVFSGEGASE